MKVIREDWIVKMPFQGHTQSIVQYFEDGSNKVAFSGGKTLEQYLEDAEEEYEIFNSDEVEQLFNEHENSLKTKPVEITEERWYEMLEVLPPCRWGTYGGYEAFHISEHLTGSLVAWFARKDGKCYEFTECCYIKNEELFKLIDAA